MAVEQRLKELLGVLDLLSRRDREVLSLVSAGLDSTAIATALDISEVAVRSRLSRSRKRLAKLVAAKRATRVPPPVKSVSSIPRQEGL
jgi:DNA-directed RNA polymerase specialized sigma24 family protein